MYTRKTVDRVYISYRVQCFIVFRSDQIKVQGVRRDHRSSHIAKQNIDQCNSDSARAGTFLITFPRGPLRIIIPFLLHSFLLRPFHILILVFCFITIIIIRGVLLFILLFFCSFSAFSRFFLSEANPATTVCRKQHISSQSPRYSETMHVKGSWRLTSFVGSHNGICGLHPLGSLLGGKLLEGAGDLVNWL